MVFCCVVGCGAYSQRDKRSYFRIPIVLSHGTDDINELSRLRRAAWFAAIKRDDFTELKAQHERVCAIHFLSGKPSALDSLEDNTNPDWVPSQNMGYKTGGCSVQSKVDRHNRAMQRSSRTDPGPSTQSSTQVDDNDTIRSIDNTAITTDTEMLEELAMDTQEEDELSAKRCQTDLHALDIDNLLAELQNRNNMIYDLRDKLNSVALNEDSFRGDSDGSKTCFYTGLPTARHLLIVFQLVEDYLPAHPNRVLSKFQMVIITLIKLRLNFPFKYLSYIFDVAPYTLSENYYHCLNVLFKRLKSLIVWPTRENLRKTMPMSFRAAFGDKVAVVLDCFEIFTEVPSDLLNSAQLWSNYKHHHTVKFLIGITPQGSVCFISEAWGGRTSDKHLDYLLPGDVVMADRGFLIEDEVRLRHADLAIPAFTKGKSQLHPLDVERTRNIGNVRINVERIIGCLRKKFTRLRGPIPVSALGTSGIDYSVLDQEVYVAACLLNLCQTVVPNV